MEEAQERIAAADIGVKKAERLAGLDRLDPDRDRAELHCHGVSIDAIETLTGKFAQGVAIVLGAGAAGRAELRDTNSKPPRGSQQEMTGANGRVDDFELD